MIVIPLTSLSFRKQCLLSKSPLEPAMYAIIEGHDYDIETNATFYVLQIGIQKGEDVICTMKKLRYSELEKLQKTLINIFPEIDTLHHFPPKKWFNNTNENFIMERQKGLQTFLTIIFGIPSIAETDVFKSFFNLKRKVNV